MKIPKPTVIHQTEGHFTINFPLGEWKEMPDEVVAANVRVSAALKALDADIDLVREWGGSVVYYKPFNQMVNPKITDDMQEALRAEAQRLYPESRIMECWKAMAHGQISFSVRLSGSPS